MFLLIGYAFIENEKIPLKPVPVKDWDFAREYLKKNLISEYLITLRKIKEEKEDECICSE